MSRKIYGRPITTPMNPKKLTEGIPQNIKDALEEAKASGAFKGDPGTSIHACTYTGTIKNNGQFAYNLDSSYFPNGEPNLGDLFVTPTGYVCRIKGLNYGTSSQGNPAATIFYSHLADIKGSAGEQGPQGEQGIPGEKGDKGDPGEQGDTGATGPAGPAGPAGADGAKGDKGDKGDPGEPGKDGSNGKDGTNGKDGADGKSAYQYAKDGGYTGTEDEFAEKLAQEAPTAFYVNFEMLEEEFVDGMLLLSMDKTVEEITAAYESGRPVFGNFMGATSTVGFVDGVITAEFDGLATFGAATKIIVIGDNGGVQGFFAYGDAVVTVNPSDNTADMTLEEILYHIDLGMNVRCNVDGTTLPLTVYSENTAMFGGVFDNMMLTVAITPENAFYFTTQLVAKSDIPTSLKNPYALTINGTTYNGSKAVNFTNTINTMIDNKLGVIENGSY